MEKITDYYRLIYNNKGNLISVNEIESGASLLFNPDTKEFDESDSLTLELRTKESEFGILDLSDIEPENKPILQNYRLNFLVESDMNIPLFRFPGDINYNTGLTQGLSTKTLDYFGLRVANIYEQLLDKETLDPLINPVKIVYERYKYNWNQETGLPSGRLKEVQFYFDDGSLDDRKKLLPKEFYNTSDRENITSSRRKTIVSWLVARSKELGLGTALEGFFGNYKDECDRYILYGDRSIIYLVNSSNEPWMDIDTTTVMGSVRNAIVLCFDKALEIPTEEEIDAFLERELIEG